MSELVKVRDSLRKSLQFRVLEPIRFAVDVARTVAAGGRQRMRKVLLVSDLVSYTTEQQFAPLLAGRGWIREELGVVFHRQLLSDALLLPRRVLRHYDIVGLKLGFRTPEADVLRIARTLGSGLAANAKLVYFDGDDDLCVQWPKLLPLVDLYVKKHCFRERSRYLEARIGKTNLTDYVARNFGISFAEDIIPHGDPVDAEQLDKIVVGWNIGLDDKIRAFHAAHREPIATARKDIDVVCRATVNQKSWIYPLRSAVIPRINAMGANYRVLAPEERVTQDVYYEEMLRSRICVSPFGYGEICWRDFEAVLCGCVLVKPDMSHVETAPDIFVPNETYVPVRWDYADLETTLAGLLADPARCERIRSNAFGVLSASLDQDGVVRAFQQILRRLDATDPAAPSASA